MVFIWEIIPFMAQQFRVVKYDHLPSHMATKAPGMMKLDELLRSTLWDFLRSKMIPSGYD